MYKTNSKFTRTCLVALLFAAAITGFWLIFNEKPAVDVVPSPVVPPFVSPVEPAVVVRPGLLLGFPTPQTRLAETNNPSVFMPTASGRVASAGYGSARTRKVGRQYLAAFHEGVDIAPMQRDSRGRAADPVFAVADGRVAYISRRAGNSSYGIYVVLLHEDRVGEYYTLYAHLASASDALAAGDTVARGTPVGQMGNSSTLGIPVQRSHLHFEFGTILNDHFAAWLRSKKMTPTHGRAHGYNLTGLNPVEMFPYMTNGVPFVFKYCITNIPVGFRMIIATDHKPDYYCRYPSLWIGGEPVDGIVIEVSAGGVPLLGRAAMPEEIASLDRKKPRVLEAFPEVLGRNGKRLVVSSHGKWIPGKNAAQWLDILLYR